MQRFPARVEICDAQVDSASRDGIEGNTSNCLHDFHPCRLFLDGLWLSTLWGTCGRGNHRGTPTNFRSDYGSEVGGTRILRVLLASEFAGCAALIRTKGNRKALLAGEHRATMDAARPHTLTVVIDNLVHGTRGIRDAQEFLQALLVGSGRERVWGRRRSKSQGSHSSRTRHAEGTAWSGWNFGRGAISRGREHSCQAESPKVCEYV